MKQARWKGWISPILLALVVLAGVWYYHPVGLDTLYPLSDPVSINVLIDQFDGQRINHKIFDVDAASPEGQALVARLEALRIRRPPTNLLFQLLPSTASGRTFSKGDYNLVLHVFDADGSWVALQFFIDAWEYDTPASSQYLPCSVSGGAAAGQELGDTLWELSQKFDSDS